MTELEKMKLGEWDDANFDKLLFSEEYGVKF